MAVAAILGASGLIGFDLAADLQRRGFAVQAIARRFTPAQAAALGDAAVAASPVSLSAEALTVLLADADVVVNCIGVLQGAESGAVHHAFVARLAGLCAERSKLLIQISVPGEAEHDRTAFSRTKRAGERAIAASGAPFLILRPGFVLAQAAYGGSALLRALAMLPFDLPPRERDAVFAVTAMGDIGATLGWTVARWRNGARGWGQTWAVMEQEPGTVDAVMTLLRARLGGPRLWFAMPGWLLSIGAGLGDAVALLGWRPPIRSTALAEIRRSVAGEPRPWMAATGIVPQSARQAVAAIAPSVQERWFARLYLLKALALAMLVIFWCASGLIALTAGFTAARGILLAHGFGYGAAHLVTIVSSLMDISVGLLIAVRRTARVGLITGVLVSLGYMAGAALLTPDMWFEPLGALVKTGPAIVLMLFCLAILDDR